MLSHSKISSIRISQEILKLPVLGEKKYFRSSKVKREECQIVMDFLKNEEIINFKALAFHINISLPQLYRWAWQLSENPDFNPHDFNVKKLAFAECIEQQLAATINNDYLLNGYFFNYSILKMLALRLWDDTDAKYKNRKIFNASNQWCRGFRLRHEYVWRLAHTRRRPFNANDEASVRNFNSVKKELILKHEEDDTQYLLANMDETSFKVVNIPKLTFAKKGQQEVIAICNGSDKEAFTAIATINYDKKKLPLMLLAKGKTEICHKQFNGIVRDESGIENFHVFHTESGWSTTDAMDHYFNQLREDYKILYGDRGFNDETIIDLMWDCYSVHRNNEIKEQAKKKNINLIFIPPGLTDKCQPLDMHVFGALKAKARKMWLDYCISNKDAVFSKRIAGSILIRAWNELSDLTIDKAWSVYEEEIKNEEELDSYSTSDNDTSNLVDSDENDESDESEDNETSEDSDISEWDGIANEGGEDDDDEESENEQLKKSDSSNDENIEFVLASSKYIIDEAIRSQYRSYNDFSINGKITNKFPEQIGIIQYDLNCWINTAYHIILNIPNRHLYLVDYDLKLLTLTKELERFQLENDASPDEVTENCKKEYDNLIREKQFYSIMHKFLSKLKELDYCIKVYDPLELISNEPFNSDGDVMSLVTDSLKESAYEFFNEENKHFKQLFLSEQKDICTLLTEEKITKINDILFVSINRGNETNIKWFNKEMPLSFTYNEERFELKTIVCYFLNPNHYKCYIRTGFLDYFIKIDGARTAESSPEISHIYHAVYLKIIKNDSICK